jgi:hypothetical protein
VGDLAEEAQHRGRLWFWRSLLGVAVAMFFNAFGCARARTLGSFAAGFVLWCAVYAGIRVLGALFGLQPLAPAGLADGAAWSSEVFLAAALIVSSFCTGLLLGLRTAASGLNACTPLAMFWAAAAVILPVADCLGGTASWRCTALSLLGLPLLYMLPLLAGGACSRRRSVAPIF